MFLNHEFIWIHTTHWSRITVSLKKILTTPPSESDTNTFRWQSEVGLRQHFFTLCATYESMTFLVVSLMQRGPDNCCIADEFDLVQKYLSPKFPSMFPMKRLSWVYPGLCALVVGHRHCISRHFSAPEQPMGGILVQQSLTVCLLRQLGFQSYICPDTSCFSGQVWDDWHQSRIGPSGSRPTDCLVSTVTRWKS